MFPVGFSAVSITIRMRTELLAVDGALGEAAFGEFHSSGAGTDQHVPEGLVGCGDSDRAIWYLSGGHWLPLRILQHETAKQFYYSSCK